MEFLLSPEFIRALAVFLIVVGVYVVVRVLHEHAGVSLDFLQGAVEGALISIGFWIGILIIIYLTSSSEFLSISKLTTLIIGTKFFHLTFIEISSIPISLFFGVEKESNGQIDYRKHAIAIMLAITFILGLYYVLRGLPETSINYP